MGYFGRPPHTSFQITLPVGPFSSHSTLCIAIPPRNCIGERAASSKANANTANVRPETQ